MHRILLLIDKIYSIFVMTDKTNDNLNMTHQSTRIGKQKITIKNDRQNDFVQINRCHYRQICFQATY